MEENEKMNEICQSDDYGGDDGNGINVTKGFCMGKSEKANQQPHHHFGQKKALSWLLLVSPLISAVTIMAIAMTIYSVMSLPHQFYAIRNLDFLIAIFVPPFIQVVIFVTFYFIATKIKTNRIYQLYEVIFLIFVIISSLL
ncbi:MAG: hypothetical protein FWC82_02285, partial [Firmicutes bacterium]|nr:hypothetical protein [Bacillota bacterium]